MQEVDKILELISGPNGSYPDEKVLGECMGMIDLTSLNTNDTDEKILEMVEKVNSFRDNFPAIPGVAAVCVYPSFASLVKKAKRDDSVNIAVVGGVFPSSQSFQEVKQMECRLAVEQGADEVDIVLSLRDFIGGDRGRAADEITAIKRVLGESHLKVILETGLLNSRDDIYDASMLALRAGADFIKTSTGKVSPAATPEAAVVMCLAIRDFYKETGEKRGFKPAGGIVTPEDAILYYNIVRTILGVEWLNKKLFRIGASRLANNILSRVENKEIKYF
jgi:deoxyribose-phosphate aldolase